MIMTSREKENHNWIGRVGFYIIFSFGCLNPSYDRSLKFVRASKIFIGTEYADDATLSMSWTGECVEAEFPPKPGA
jgi:hypothetical protein